MFRSYKSILALGAAVALAGSASATATEWADLQTTDLSAAGVRMLAANQALYVASSGNKNIAKYAIGADGNVDGTTFTVSYTATAKMGNGWQGTAISNDGAALYMAADGASISDADPAIIVKLNAADGSVDESFAIDGTMNNVGRRGALASLSDGRLLTFGLGHAAAPEYVPFYNIVSADGMTSSAAVYFDQNCANGGSYVLDDGTTVAGTIRSAATKFGADAASDKVFFVKGGTVLEMTATDGDWSSTPTVKMFFDKELGTLPWQVNTQITYDAVSDMLYFAVPGKLYSINASDAADYSLLAIGGSQYTVAQTWIGGKTFAYVNGANVFQMNAYAEKAKGSVKATFTGVTEGAWKLNEAGAWNASGDQIDNLYIGSYDVIFKDVEGYFTPATQTVTVEAGAVAEAAGEYVKVSDLKVTLTGPAAGAQWSIDKGATWNESGATVSNLTAGKQTITFKAVEGWAIPADFEQVTLETGSTTEKTYAYTEKPAAAAYQWTKAGSYDLSDLTTTAAAISRMTTDNDGNLYFNLGIAKFVFRVAAAEATAPTTGTVLATGTAGTYGFLGMDFFPNGGVAFENNKDMFKYNNDGTLAEEWGTTGTFTFSEGRQAIACYADGTILGIPAAGGTYALRVAADGKTADTKVTGSGPTTWSNRDACGRGNGTIYVCNGYKRIDKVVVVDNAIYSSVNGFVPAKSTAYNGGVFYDALYNDVNLAVGDEGKVYISDADTGALKQTIVISGAPSDTAVANETLFVCKTNRTVDYFVKGTKFTVNLVCADEVNAPQFSIDGGATWKNSGEFFILDPDSTTVTVSFKPVPGWNTPASQDVAVNEEVADVALTAEYWQPTVTATATEGGTITPAGDITTTVGESLTFTMAADDFYNYTSLEVDGAPVLPNPETFTFENLTEDHTINAVFTRQVAGSLTVNLDPATSTSWSIDGTNWNASGATLEALPAGNYVINFRSLSGYRAPSAIALTMTEGVSVTKSAAYTPVAGFVDWMKYKDVVVAPESISQSQAYRTNWSRLDFDKAHNVYIGGYGAFGDAPYGMGSGGVVTFPFNNATVPAASDIKVAVQSFFGLWPAEWTAGGTNGMIGLTPAIDGGMLLHQDSGYNFSFKTKEDGTTDTAFGTDGVRPTTNRYASVVTFPNGDFGLVSLVIPGNMTIIDGVTGAEKGSVSLAGFTQHLRSACAATTDTVFILDNAYKRIMKLVFDPVTYNVIQASELCTPVNGGQQAGIYYIAKDNTVVYTTNLAGGKFIQVFGADSGQLIQTFAGDYCDIAYTNTEKGDFLVGCSYSNTTLGVYKRAVAFTVNMPGAPEGAQWSPDGGTTWFAAGAGFAPQAADNTILFKDVEGYFTPASVVVPEAEREYTLAEGTYVAKVGDITVNLAPEGAAPLGGWMLVNSAMSPTAISSWNASGATEADVPFGQYTVTFKDVAGYQKPDDMAVDLTTTEGLVLTGTYRQVGTLTVVIDGPAEAKWIVSGIDGLFNSGQTLKLEAGEYTVSFTEVADWVKPADMTVTITGNNDSKTLVGVYDESTGSISVSIEPAAAVSEGAKWSVDGGATWNESGATVADLDPDEYTVIFSDLGMVRWASPAPIKVTVSSGQTATATGTYSRYAEVWELF